jgi:hypothetical protein
MGPGTTGTKRQADLALTLFVLGVFADDANDAAAVDHFALVTNLLYGRADLHNTPKAAVSFSPIAQEPRAGRGSSDSDFS